MREKEMERARKGNNRERVRKRNSVRERGKLRIKKERKQRKK